MSIVENNKYHLDIKTPSGDIDLSKLSLIALGAAHKSLEASLMSGEKGVDTDLLQDLSDLLKFNVSDVLTSMAPELIDFDLDSFLKNLSMQVAQTEIEVREGHLYEGEPTFENIYAASIYQLATKYSQAITVLKRTPEAVHENDDLQLDLVIDVQVIISGDSWLFNGLSHNRYQRKINDTYVSEADEPTLLIYSFLVLALVYEKTRQRLKHRLKVAKANSDISDKARQISLIIPVSVEDSLLYAIDFYLFKTKCDLPKEESVDAIKQSLMSEVGCTAIQAEKVASLFF